jgi:signal peptidase I
MERWPMIDEIIKKRRNRAALWEESINLLLRIIMIVVIGYLIFTQVFLLARVKGNEMFPALKDGDLIVGFRLQKSYEKNDIVSYKVDGVRKLGRYMAREKDVITMDESGTLRINGTIQSGEILYPTYAKDGIDYPYQVPEDHVFILGDFRTQTLDSRDYGAIPMDDIEGKVITLLRRRGL